MLVSEDSAFLFVGTLCAQNYERNNHLFSFYFCVFSSFNSDG